MLTDATTLLDPGARTRLRRPPLRRLWRPAVSPAVRAALWRWGKVLVGVAILVVLVWRVGTGGFRDGLRLVNASTLVAAMGIGVLTTVLNSWRWRLVARGLGISLPLATATADNYRAMFLNAALPGGVLGDVHRAVRHGRDLGDLGLGIRAVALERVAGQVVVVAAGIALLLAFPTPVLSPRRLLASPVIVGAVLVAVAAIVVVGSIARRRTRTATAAPAEPGTAASAPRWVRAYRIAARTIRHGLLSHRVWPGVVATSAAALAGYLATFLLAARAAGVTAPTAQVLPLLVLALLATALPTNVGGWGPREGVCAWAFAAAGLGAAQGLTVSVIYGLSVFAVSLPGAGVLVVRWTGHRRMAATGRAGRPVSWTGVRHGP